MLIDAPCVVSLTWTLTDGHDRPIDELAAPVEFYFGGDDLLAKVEEALQGQEAPYETHLHLEPEHAFGDYKSELVCFENRELFPEKLEIGMAFEGLPEGSRTPDMPADAVYLVTEIYASHVVLDANHPLAGMSLRLHVRVQDARPATNEEIEARSVANGELTVLDPGPTGMGPLH